MLLFIVTLVLTKVNTDTWQTEFLATTLIIVVLININSAIFQGGIFGLAGSFPQKYMKTLLSGQVNIMSHENPLSSSCQGGGGVVVASINVALLAVGGDQVEAAFYCFLFSVIYLMGSVLAFVYLSRTSLYYQCITSKTKSSSSEPDESTLLLQQDQDTPDKTVSVAAILRKIKIEALAVFIIYVVTLGLFPAVTVLIEPTNIASHDLWETKYFVPVSCFLFYNIGDYMGRLMIETSVAPRICSNFALVLSLIRFSLIPLMLMCNILPDQRQYLPVYFDSDAVYIILIFVLSISNGYLTSVVMVNAPGKVHVYEQQTASNLMVGILGLGLISGAAVSALLINIL